jgi:general L-amino acid transport system permease protein
MPGRAMQVRQVPLLRRAGVRATLYQVVAALIVLGICWYFAANAMTALGRLGIATGFGFLTQPAGFGIGESAIAFAPSDTYLRAYAVGLLNTLKVAALGILFATFVGLAIGLARLSSNILVSGFATVYVELFRNTPQLLQIVFWYALAINLPRPRQAYQPLPDVFLSNRGLFVPWPDLGGAGPMLMAALLLGILAAWILGRRASRAPTLADRAITLLIVIGPALLVWFISAAELTWDRPALRGLNFRGGARLSPEFLALLLGLGLYIGAFIAEIVRAGVLSVPQGQLDAARAVGLRPAQVTRFVIMPQALRLMIPPATGQYVSLAKNSSLAVAIGYPDIVNIGNTTINQTGQVVEGVVIIASVYLTISLVIASAMNLYNRVVMTRFDRA